MNGGTVSMVKIPEKKFLKITIGEKHAKSKKYKQRGTCFY
ncbi:hypothetical protein LCGC14_1904130 [marine sediment metagenome]|uniref:Uncharacterized protein n=1 Tax=marine sediment metagenome TaxID=412755 RepID=A0A0F9FVZ8_9ZZZZ